MIKINLKFDSTGILFQGAEGAGGRFQEILPYPSTTVPWDSLNSPGRFGQRWSIFGLHILLNLSHLSWGIIENSTTVILKSLFFLKQISHGAEFDIFFDSIVVFI
jgi:hypothetical protein